MEIVNFEPNRLCPLDSTRVHPQLQPRTSTSELKRQRLTPQDWVKAALELLVQDGIEGVRVDNLARKLGVTKGSFYWHFKSRDELLDALAESWGETEGETFMNQVLAAPGDPRSKLVMLGAIYLRENYPAYERAMRGWALNDPRAAEAITRASVRTMRTLTQIYSDMGFQPEDAAFRARMHRLAGIGTLFAVEFDMESMPDDERTALRKRFFDLLTQTPATPAGSAAQANSAPDGGRTMARTATTQNPPKLN